MEWVKRWVAGDLRIITKIFIIFKYIKNKKSTHLTEKKREIKAK